MSKATKPTLFDYAAWILVAMALLAVLQLHLVVVTLCGFIIFEMVHSLSRFLVFSRLSHQRARIYSVVVISTIIAVLLSLMVVAIYAFFPSDSQSISALFIMMAQILDESQQMLPAVIAENMPKNAEELRIAAVEWLKTNAGALPVAGKEAVLIATHIVIGVVLGSMISLMQVIPSDNHRPLARALMERVFLLRVSFHQVFVPQACMAALSAFFTWLYLGVALPLLDNDLPFIKIMVAITFIAGLLPIVGNLISSAIVVVVSLSISPLLAMASIGFFALIYTLEYFLRKRFFASHRTARAWELLLAMLFMEAVFGFRGLVVAPIYYVYLKNELSEQGQI